MRFDKLGATLTRLAAVLAGGVMLGGPSRAAAITITNVSIRDNFFSPSSVTINVNDQVNWTWIGINPHSTTQTAATPLWDSGLHGNGFDFTQAFPTAGTFAYHCTLHTFMTGSVTVQAAANTPPTVSISSPANGTVFNAPATFTLTATASDPGGSVTNVQFLQGTTSLGNATTSPYSVQVNNLAAGSYTFSAVATDNGGLKATNAIAVIVNALPTVAILSPATGATFAAPWTGAVQGSTGDSDGTVTNVSLFAGGTLLASVNSPGAAFSVPVANLAAGNYSLTAVAKDNRGGSTTSAAVQVAVVTPVATLLSAPKRNSSTSFQFSYAANVGLRYVVQRSANLSGWTSLVTNTAGSNPVVFIDINATTTPAFYRVGRLPNP